MYICRTLPLDTSAEKIQEKVNGFTQNGGTLVSAMATPSALIFIFNLHDPSAPELEHHG
jgi:hypothetical protein